MEPTATKALDTITGSSVTGAILVVALVALALVSGILIRVLLARAAEVRALATEREAACKGCRERHETEVARLNGARLDDLKRAGEDAVRTLAEASRATTTLVTSVERLTDAVRRITHPERGPRDVD